MAFDAEKLTTLGAQLKGGISFQTFGYLGDVDNKATISFAGFFTPVKNSLCINDLIKVLDTTTDTTFVYWLRVTRIPLTGDVEVEETSAVSNPIESKIIDEDGNFIDSHTDADGDYHLGTSIIQTILTSAGNSSTTNLASGATFTGTLEETFGVNGIQTYLFADQNCTVYVDQSLNGTDWDITDELTCLANDGCSRTIASVAPYFRIRVTNDGASTTTEFRVAAGTTPIISPLPRALTDDQRLRTETTITGRENSNRHAWINPTNEQAVSPVYRIVGTNFDGNTKDTNFWTDGSLLDGIVTQAGGEIDLETNGGGTTAASSAKYTSVRKARFVAGSAQLFNGGFNFNTAYTENNIRRVGAYTTTAAINTPVDGFYFELNNATFSVNSRANAGTVSSFASGSFNGAYGTTWAPTADTYYQLAIEFTPLAALFYVDGKLLHKIPGAQQSYFMTLPITIENLNTSGSTNVSFETVGMYIARQGELLTNPTSYYHAYAAEAGVNLKIGPGTVHTIIFGAAANNAVVTISDSTTGTTPTLWVYDATGALDQPISVDMGGLIFDDGLRLTITNSASCTIVYE